MENKDFVEFHDTHVHYLLHWEKQLPQKDVFVQPLANGNVVHYTWSEVAQQVRSMASYLQSLNLPEKSAIAIYGKNSAHWLMADLAIWMSGHISVPLYPTLNAEGAAYVLNHSEAKLLFIGKLDGKADSWNEVKTIIPQDLACVRLALSPEFDAPQWNDIVQSVAPLENPVLPNKNDLATIVYTSGSTGVPKGVMQSFATLLSGARELRLTYQVTTSDRALSYLPLAHVAERIFIQSSLMVCGFTVYFANSIETFVEDLNRAKPTLFFSVPRLWTKFYLGVNEKIPLHIQKILFKIPVLGKLVKKKLLTKLGLNHVRYAFTAAAPLPTDIILWYRNLGLELLEVYGMTENCGYSHVTRVGQFASGYVGHAQPKVECKIDENGEILVKSPGTMLGYYKNPEKTAEDMTEDGFLRTGDLGEIDAEGRLKITGRIKDIFKTSKGKYIMPVPTEQKIGNQALIESVCIGGSSQPQPVAFIMLAEDIRNSLKQNPKRDEIENTLKALRLKINEELEAHAKISFFVVVNEPWTMENDLLTPTMKIKRNKIESHYEPFLDAWAQQKKEVVWE
ncbi:AMP-binding protein [Acinetobacter guillouiae]|uniref:AMP-binding protein n=1 Tax=Acinetobacter TaxID=469 RepID=UPI00141B64AF|nr:MULTISPECIES: AMP-binding protein [Acinetobacter]MCS4297165.1 long-subunit acyl-CoA synthetase (AMP-forming) [Acinetobacter guillouiae]MCW2250154.1 long-subunit acyl-CoA synthetase (AMP-forming) [Acinetobacter sp. BIGb0204]NII39258.1 long-subunit acyl-CoA synthetase (AMP-forming) [Acinetobacter sp. BIGb0196]